jgi:hypothetical protein
MTSRLLPDRAAPSAARQFPLGCDGLQSFVAQLRACVAAHGLRALHLSEGRGR